VRVGLFIIAVVLSWMFYASADNWIEGIRDWRLAIALQKSPPSPSLPDVIVPVAGDVKDQAVREIDRAIYLSAAALIGTILTGYGLMWHRKAQRVARRRANGICIRCAYDLTGNTSGVCPECGTAVAGKAGA
jgi:hypothetical protein